MFLKIFLTDASKHYHNNSSRISHHHAGLIFLRERVKKAEWDTERTDFNSIKHLNKCLHLSLSLEWIFTHTNFKLRALKEKKLSVNT